MIAIERQRVQVRFVPRFPEGSGVVTDGPWLRVTAHFGASGQRRGPQGDCVALRRPLTVRA